MTTPGCHCLRSEAVPSAIGQVTGVWLAALDFNPRVAPQQSLLPFHRPPTNVAQSCPSGTIKCVAQSQRQGRSRGLRHPCRPIAVVILHARLWRSSALALVPACQLGCHLYFARRVTFLSFADRGSTPRPGCRIGIATGLVAVGDLIGEGRRRSRRWSARRNFILGKERKPLIARVCAGQSGKPRRSEAARQLSAR
jgi:hypothetical protein